MNILLDGLPSSVEIAGTEVEISTGYRTGIYFEQAIDDWKLTSREKLDTALALYFPGVVFHPSVKEEAVDKLLWFYRCGREKRPESEGGSGGGTKSFSYEHDAGYMYAAFLQAYGIDLTKEDIHWWQFRALFESLPEDTMLVKIIGYRTAEVPPKASSETRQRIERLKRIYALPLDADRQQAMTDLEDILRNGGDLSAFYGNGGADGSCHTTAP